MQQHQQQHQKKKPLIPQKRETHPKGMLRENKKLDVKIGTQEEGHNIGHPCCQFDPGSFFAQFLPVGCFDQ